MPPIIEIDELGIDFGGLRALDALTLTILDNEIVGLIGPNGAGKTTVFNLLTSVYSPTRGRIRMNDEGIHGRKTHQITRGGIARTFQNIRLFSNISVLDNVKIAMHNQMSYGLFSAIFRLPNYWREEREIEAQAYDLLKVFSLEQFGNDLAGSLPYGAQRKLEIARALATKPRLLLLDEPAAGMNDTETAELKETIRFIRKEYNLSILLIEHNMNLVMDLCDRLIVLDYGIVIASGSPEQIKNDPQVIKAYLGTS